MARRADPRTALVTAHGYRPPPEFIDAVLRSRFAPN